MFCKKVRKSIDKFCAKDFFYEIKLYKKSKMKTRNSIEDNPTHTIEKEIAIQCHLEEKSMETEINGEMVSGNTFLEIIMMYIDDSEDIQKNPLKWFIEHDGEIYQVKHGKAHQRIKQYFSIVADRVNS